MEYNVAILKILYRSTTPLNKLTEDSYLHKLRKITTGYFPFITYHEITEQLAQG